MRIDVAPTADAVIPADLGGVTALVIDVLRASTTIITALANGSASVSIAVVHDGVKEHVTVAFN